LLTFCQKDEKEAGIAQGWDKPCPTVKRVVAGCTPRIMNHNDQMGEERRTTLRNMALP